MLDDRRHAARLPPVPVAATVAGKGRASGGRGRVPFAALGWYARPLSGRTREAVARSGARALREAGVRPGRAAPRTGARARDKFADVHDMLGVIAHNAGRYVDAERLERALALNPNYTEAALNLAVTYNDRGKFAKAREIYKRIKGRPTGDTAALDPFARGKIANMHAELAQAYIDANMPREAIGEYEKAVRLCPDFADLHTKLGTLLRQSGDPCRPSTTTRPPSTRGRRTFPRTSSSASPSSRRATSIAPRPPGRRAGRSTRRRRREDVPAHAARPARPPLAAPRRECRVPCPIAGRRRGR